MIVRRLHPFEYQYYATFAKGLDPKIDIIFSEPTTNVIVAAIKDDIMIGAVHIDTVAITVCAINSETFDDALLLGQNWCQHHNVADPAYMVLMSTLTSSCLPVLSQPVNVQSETTSTLGSV